MKIGLCQTCFYMRTVETKRGSVFYLCALAKEDSRFSKYPSLPVLSCLGYEKKS